MKVAAQIRLSEKQNAAFNTLYIDAQEFQSVEKYLREIIPSGQPFHMVDFGGGNGRFADILIEAFPDGVVHNVDVSRDLLERNTPHPRKIVAAASLLDYAPNVKFHAIFFNYVLHHMVAGSLRETRDLISNALGHARELLAENGRVVVFENILEGLVSDQLSSELLFRTTSSRMLAPFTGWLGANTAGVGVYYMGAGELTSLAESQGLRLLDSFCLRRPQHGPRIWPCLAKARLRPCYIFASASRPI